MVVKIANNFRNNSNGHRINNKPTYAEVLESKKILPVNAKILAWCIFLIFFIESGTLGLIPKNFYFVYRNMRVSDFLIYGLTIYSLFNVREFSELYRSKLMILIKVIFIFFFAQFIISTILYNQNIFEYFFRLKGLWSSLLVFPFLLLLKRNALPYLIKLILPVAIIANILYILTAITGIALMPDIGVEKTTVGEGFKVYRVFGGTFFGELFFLAFIYQWITDKFKLWQFPLVLLFVTPHILAFGRSAWVRFAFTILVIFVWNFLKNREFKVLLRQAVLIVLLISAAMYVFIRFVPQSDYLSDAVSSRVNQGQEDVENKTGTYGTRLANIDALLLLWSNGNVLFGIGMHPMWVISPQTTQETIYVWGFSDVRWASVLAAYGLLGMLLALLFQILMTYQSTKILIKTKSTSIYTFFILILFTTLLFDMTFNYSYIFITLGLLGLTPVVALCTAITVYKTVYIDK